MASARSRKGATDGRSLSKQQILEVAIRICDENDIDSLTLRGLAAELDAGTMTMYSYFRSKEEILDGMADHIMGAFAIPEIDSAAAPGDVFCALGEALLQMMRDHPCVVRLLSTRVTASPGSMRGALEAIVGRLREAGYTGQQAVRAYGLLMTYTLGCASYQTPRPWGRSSQPDVEELRRQRRHFYASLSRDEFPNMIDYAEDVVAVSSDEQFSFGLRVMAQGLLADAGTSPDS